MYIITDFRNNSQGKVIFLIRKRVFFNVIGIIFGDELNWPYWAQDLGAGRRF